MGVGEFTDLLALIDFCSKIGFRVIQLLPVNDTSCFMNWRDSYPYSSLSVFALHPLYLRLQSLTSDKNLLKRIKEKNIELNKNEQIDYEATMQIKKEFMQEIYSAIKSKKDPALNAWVKDNMEWLKPYAIFVTLRDKYGTSKYSEWPEHKSPSKFELDTLMKKFQTELNFVFWVQYQLHIQLKVASEYANQHRVALKGDLPIGVNRDSVDTWVNPHIFNMNMSTGAPPDQFSHDGQNWGFPTYDWEVMHKDDYTWWNSRLLRMANYFDAFRIDHILGFFRIWEIPTIYQSGMMGHYNPSIAIHRHHLENLGLWDINRFVEPYVRFDVVSRFSQLRHEQVSFILKKYFNVIGNDRYLPKPEFNSHVKINEHLLTLPNDNPDAQSWIQKISDIFKAVLTNVILLRHPTDPDLFFPRVNLTSTVSFYELEERWKQPLFNLYNAYFYGQAQEDYWSQIGSSRLPMIKSATKMLVCGEDLGMVPKCVEPAMSQLGILGLRVQRMPSDPKIPFGNPHYYDYLTVCTTSSHDTSTLREWWEEDRFKSIYFYRNILHEGSDVPIYCEPWLVEKILNQHFYSPSMLAIFPIQDLFAIDQNLRVKFPASERINQPSNPQHYWRYRIHLTLEKLNNETNFIEKISKMTEMSGRKF